VGKLGRLEVGDGADSLGPVVRETRERRPAPKARIKREDVTDVWAGWADEGWFWPAGAARPVGWLGQRPSGPQGRPGRNQEKEFLN
jgi:hypothetical protein